MDILGFTGTQIISILSLLGLGAVIQLIVQSIINKKTIKTNIKKTEEETDKIKSDKTSIISETAIKVMNSTAERLDKVLCENRAMQDRISSLENEVRELRIQLDQSNDLVVIELMLKLIETPCLILEADTGKIIDANETTEKIYGYSHEELLNMHMTDLSAEPEKTLIYLKERNIRLYNRLHKTSKGIVFYIDAVSGYYTRKNIDYCIAIIKPKHNIEISDRVYDFLDSLLREFDASHVAIWNFNNGDFSPDGMPLFKINTKFEEASEEYKSVLNIDKDIPIVLFESVVDKIKNNDLIIINSSDSTQLSGLLKYIKMSTMIACRILEDNKTIGILSISYGKNRVFSKEELDKILFYSKSDLLKEVLK